MRISCGRLKGRKIASQRAFSKKRDRGELRPTSAKVREAIFDILRGEIDGAAFLDLFAGTGTVGFEALSRGASTACFVEDEQTRGRAITDFITRTGLEERTCVYSDRAEDFLKRGTEKGMTFDIIFADPPYASGEIGKILPFLAEGALLRQGGCLIIEHAARSPLHDDLTKLKIVKSYRYGDTMLTLYRKEG